MMKQRNYTIFDRICLGLDQVVRALTDNVQTTQAAYPAEKLTDAPELTDDERRHAAGLMRVNHAGEICAQALYHGQGLVSRNHRIQAHMQQAALEEGDHLAWCKQRLDELQSHTSYLKPLWYAGSFCIGMVAGLIGDKWSLGFVVETERQVIKHLESHIHLLPMQDSRSYQILKQMEADETKHRNEAIASGAHELPMVVKKGMALTAKVMVKTAYWV